MGIVTSFQRATQSGANDTTKTVPKPITPFVEGPALNTSVNVSIVGSFISRHALPLRNVELGTRRAAGRERGQRFAREYQGGASDVRGNIKAGPAYFRRQVVRAGGSALTPLVPTSGYSCASTWQVQTADFNRPDECQHCGVRSYLGRRRRRHGLPDVGRMRSGGWSKWASPPRCRSHPRLFILPSAVVANTVQASQAMAFACRNAAVACRRCPTSQPNFENVPGDAAARSASHQSTRSHQRVRSLDKMRGTSGRFPAWCSSRWRIKLWLASFDYRHIEPRHVTRGGVRTDTPTRSRSHTKTDPVSKHSRLF